VQEKSGIRTYDGKGRHTTTVRQLFVLKGGVLIIDTPRLREVGIGTRPLQVLPIRSRISQNLRRTAAFLTTGMSRSRAVQCVKRSAREFLKRNALTDTFG
jgi:hypothetical protein